MKLYRVSFAIDVCVLAETASEAENFVTFDSAWRNDVPTGIASAFEVQCLNDVPKQLRDTLPYAADGSASERTVDQIIVRREAETVED
jgi:hypothetical protein